MPYVTADTCVDAIRANDHVLPVFHQQHLKESQHKRDEQSIGREVVDPMFQTRYWVEVKSYEFPVIGTFVDPRITPGFYYRVRRLSSGHFLWGGKARCLVTIGMGYGKRITFQSDDVTDNTDCYFYSDTETEGFALVPAVPELTNQYVMEDEEGKTVADVNVTAIDECQVQLTGQTNQTSIVSRVFCSLMCDIHSSSLMPSQSRCTLQGVALLRKKAESKEHCSLVSIGEIRHNQQIYSLIPVPVLHFPVV